MSVSPHLESLVSVGPRFARSVSLVRDANHVDALDGYILTPTGRDVLHRLADAIRGENSTRAWSLTGPYGSGKSAFALLVAQALAGEVKVRRRARDYLASVDADLSERLFGDTGLPGQVGRFCPVLVTGSRQPLEKALATALARSLRGFATRGRKPQVIDDLEKLAAQTAVSGTAIVAMFEEANEYLARFSPENVGILLIIDELGKFLERGAINPEQGDIFVLQELAEAATRSPRPFLFLTILHQALDRYVEHMSPGRRAEWAKIQGRFEDVAFEERTEQQLRLLSHAIQHQGEDADVRLLRRQAKVFVQSAASLNIRVGSMALSEIQECLAACYPLHPLTALVLGPLFRQFAQNERSLFAFLVSSEPFGFQDFLREKATKDGPYRLDRLYDYLMTSLGPSLFAQHRGKRWSEVQSALERLYDASETEVFLAKSIGLLQILGSAVGILPSGHTLQAAMKGVGTESEIEAALRSLTRRSVVVFRRHTGSYALWEGSDVDIEDRLQVARQSVERDQNLAAFLTREAPPQPLIARRHYFQTGTLRYFEVVFCDRSDLQGDLFQSRLTGEALDADGRVVLCLPRDSDDRESMRRSVEALNDPTVIVAIPQDVFDLRELCHDLVCLRWVEQHTPELETDRTARREIRARLTAAEQSLQTRLDWIFSSANEGCLWYHCGHKTTLASQKQMNDLLSLAADKAYPSTPTWRNELINRRSLSSSAAAARRNLIEAMFENPDKERLGIEGTPPERSMYETLLRASGLHRRQGDGFAFLPPGPKAEQPIKDLWKALDEFLNGTENGRQSVERLFAVLRAKPFGLKNGVLPVLLAVVLVHGHSQVALYEEGSFVPRPNAAVFERIFRSPEKFDLQRFRITGPRAEVFQQYAAMVMGAKGGEPDLLGIVRPLVRAVKDLPDYVGKTKQIGEYPQRVLKAMKEARQPDRLLFVDLPTACGYPAFEASGNLDVGRVNEYFARLRQAFTDLQRAYPQLLHDIERLILAAFKREGRLSAVRKAIEHDARSVLNIAVDQKLKAFLLRVVDTSTEDATWLESIATLLAGKPPTHWDDQDRARFEVQLASTARTFEHFVTLAFEMEHGRVTLLGSDPKLLRISVTTPGAKELERVVQVPAAQQRQAEQAREQVLRILKDGGLLDKRDVGVAVLAELVRQLLDEGT
jgi:hypothetical protein